MHIACPSCAATYDLPERQLAGGRAVRCARCGTSWTPVPLTPPPPAAATSVAGPVPLIPAPPRPPRVMVLPQPAVAAGTLDSRRPNQRQLLLAAWALSIAVLLLAGWAAVTWREGIMRAWPPSERAYAALGLAGPARR